MSEADTQSKFSPGLARIDFSSAFLDLSVHISHTRDSSRGLAAEPDGTCTRWNAFRIQRNRPNIQYSIDISTTKVLP
jgi:hypothetical protein